MQYDIFKPDRVARLMTDHPHSLPLIHNGASSNLQVMVKKVIFFPCRDNIGRVHHYVKSTHLQSPLYKPYCLHYHGIKKTKKKTIQHFSFRVALIV